MLTLELTKIVAMNRNFSKESYVHFKKSVEPGYLSFCTLLNPTFVFGSLICSFFRILGFEKILRVDAIMIDLYMKMNSM